MQLGPEALTMMFYVNWIGIRCLGFTYVHQPTAGNSWSFLCNVSLTDFGSNDS